MQGRLDAILGEANPDNTEVAQLLTALDSWVGEIYGECPRLVGIVRSVEDEFEDSAAGMAVQFPELVELGPLGIITLVEDDIDFDAFAEDTCLAACAAEATLFISAAITGWGAAMVGCIGSGPFYPICAGLATATKYLVIAGVGIGLGNCVNACNKVPQRRRNYD